MDSYIFLRDLFDTYQSLSDGIKLAWLLVPAMSLIAVTALFMHYRVALKAAEQGITGDLIYTVRRDPLGQLQVYQHAPKLDHPPTLLLLSPLNVDQGEDKREG